MWADYEFHMETNAEYWAKWGKLVEKVDRGDPRRRKTLENWGFLQSIV